jgi:hypothetical protein
MAALLNDAGLLISGITALAFIGIAGLVVAAWMDR